MPDSLTDDILWLVCNRQFAEFRALVTPRRRGSTAFRCCRMRRGRWAWATATACARCRSRRAIDDRGTDRFRRPPGSDAQLLRTRARQPRLRAQRAAGRESARGRAAGARQDARTRRARLPAGGAAAARAPDVPALRALGLRRQRPRRARRAGREAPALLAACSSAAAMWVANAATVSASADTADGRVHFTPANLGHPFPPRARGADDDARCCARSSPTTARFVVHDPLARGAAARRRRCGQSHALRRAPRGAGVEFFVYGRRAYGDGRGAARAFPRGRRARRAKAIARRHGLDPARTLFAQQRPRRSTPACSTTT